MTGPSSYDERRLAEAVAAVPVGIGGAWDLMPHFIAAVIPPLYGQEDKGDYAIVYVKWFAPVGAATWFITEFGGSAEPRLAFGWCDLGLGTPELGYVSLDEVRQLRLPLGLRVERDLWFAPKWLGEVKGGGD